jgi:hypothetical protein
MKYELKQSNNQKNAVERGGTQCVEVDVGGIMSGNTVECSVNQIEAICSLTRGEGTRYNVILCKMGVVGKYK